MTFPGAGLPSGVLRGRAVVGVVAFAGMTGAGVVAAGVVTDAASSETTAGSFRRASGLGTLTLSGETAVALGSRAMVGDV